MATVRQSAVLPSSSLVIGYATELSQRIVSGAEARTPHVLAPAPTLRCQAQGFPPYPAWWCRNCFGPICASLPCRCTRLFARMQQTKTYAVAGEPYGSGSLEPQAVQAGWGVGITVNRGAGLWASRRCYQTTPRQSFNRYRRLLDRLARMFAARESDDWRTLGPRCYPVLMSFPEGQS